MDVASTARLEYCDASSAVFEESLGLHDAYIGSILRRSAFLATAGPSCGLESQPTSSLIELARSR
jgi:hypothetical protein